MDSMREQMQALTQGIAASARARQMAVDNSKVLTARMLQSFGRERTAMAETLESGFAADREARMVNTGAILSNTGAMRQAFRQDQVRMRRGLRSTLAESTEAVERFVDSLRADISKGCADVAKAHRHMAKTQRTALAKERRDRSRDVAKLINNFHAARGEMAQELAESLSKTTQDVKFCVSGLNEWRTAALHKTRENASVPGAFSFLNHMPAVQGSGENQAPFAVSSTAAITASQKRAKKKDT